MNGLGSRFQCSAHLMIAALSSATLVNAPRRRRFSVSSLNQRSTRFSQELHVGMKCRCHRRAVRQPLPDLGCGVSVQVVHDEVEVQLGRERPRRSA